ncbi:MAG: hypothetical protein K2I69_00115 [Muribaculaceae bacterium]|nr:hypothetical protein [Muribaculaceae bacterium]
MVSNKVKRNLSYTLFVLCCICIVANVWALFINPAEIAKWCKLVCYLMFAVIFFRNFTRFRNIEKSLSQNGLKNN